MFVRRLTLLLLLFLGYNFLYPKYCYSINQLPETAEEWFYVINYDAFKFNIILFEYNKQNYLPINELLNLFKINGVSDKSGNISGFYINPDSTYSIKFDDNLIEIRNQKYGIDSIDYIKTDLETFVTPKIISLLFGIQLEIDKSKLAIMMESKQDLPILLGYKRSKKYSNSMNNGDAIEFGPLLSDRNYNIINGGVLDYTIQSEQNNNVLNHNINNNVRLELLGGDFQIRTLASLRDNNNLFYNNNFEWNYTVMDNSNITNIKVGHLTQNLMRSSILSGININYPMILGVQLTNERFEESNLFDNLVFNEKVGPNWQIELYMNNQLFAQTTADGNGIYRLTAPIRYGTTDVSLKYYGLFGEQYETNILYFIPNDFLSPGTFRYTLSGGLNNGIADNYIVDGRSSLGVTDWLTSSVVVQKFINNENINYMNSNSVRLGGGYQLNFGFTSHNQSGIGLRYFEPNIGVYDILYSRFDNQSNGILQKIEFTGGLPRIEWLPFALSVRGFHQFSEDTESTSINTYFGTQIFGLSLMANYGYNSIITPNVGKRITETLNGSINIDLGKKPDWLSFMGPTFITFNLGYDFDYRKVRLINGSINQSFNEKYYLSLSSSYDIITRSTVLFANINLSFDAFRSNSTARLTDEMKTFSHQIQGSVTFDPANFDLSFNNRINQSNTIGESSVLIRLFLDENMDGKLNENEMIIPNVSLKVEGGRGGRIQATEKGTYIKSLVPNYKYNSTVILKSIKNPMWKPFYEDFSFITDPNTLKNIDIPCFASSVVEGKVTKTIESKEVGQSGVKIHFINKDGGANFTIPVFKDGTYYSLDITPGNYDVYIDSLQLSILKRVSYPAKREIKLKTSESGDFISDLNFHLVNVDSVEFYENFVKNKDANSNATEYPITGKLSPITNDTVNVQSDVSDSLLIATVDLKRQKDVISPSIANIDNKKVDKKGTPEIPNINDEISIGKLRPLFYTKSKVTFLAPGMKRYLDRVADFMLSNPKVKILVEGHSDSFGSLEDNYNVSHQRSKEVMNYLVSKGIDVSRIISTAYGALRPLVESKTPQEKMKNMRVELNLVESTD